MSEMTLQELQAHKEAIEADIAARIEAEQAEALEQIKAVVDLYRIPVEKVLETLGGLPKAKRASVGVPKYRDPETGATWTGRGAAPRWILGKQREAFLIEPEVNGEGEE